MGRLLSIYTVSLFGHRKIEHFSPVEQALEPLVRKLLKEKEYVDFLVGREGDFDQIATWVIRRARRDLGDANSEHICVLPYDMAVYRNNTASFATYYSRVEICEASAIAHPKAAIQVRNRAMVDRSDLCVFYVNQKHGGAFQTLRYAQKCGKVWLNFAYDACEMKK